LVFFILAYMLQKSMTIELPLSRAFYEQRKRKLVVSGLLAGSGFLLFVLTMVLIIGGDVDQPWTRVAGIVLGSLIFLAGIGWMNRVYNIISASKIDGDYAWIKGVDSGYLERLPVWPYA